MENDTRVAPARTKEKKKRENLFLGPRISRIEYFVEERTSNELNEIISLGLNFKEIFIYFDTQR